MHKPKEPYLSQKSAPDKGTQATGRSRGTNAKPYPVPWSIGPEPAPKFPGEKLRHISELSDEEFGRFMQKYPERLEVYEKVDGAVAMTFGTDANGYWSAKKTGPKRRSVVEYQGPHDEICREAHLAASGLVIPEGTFFSADILYGTRPNTIKYDGKSRIVIHALYSESTGGQVSRHRLNRGNGVAELSSGWIAEYRRPLRIEEFATTLVLEGANRQVTESAIVGELCRIPSQYGGEFIEGLVVRDPETGDLVKIVDKEVFTKRNQQFWEYRDELDRGRKTSKGWKKGIKATFRESYAERVLGTRSILGPKPKFESIKINRFEAARHLTYDTYLAVQAVNSLNEEWSYNREQFPTEIVERTEAAFDEAYRWLGEMDRLGRRISEGEDLKTLVRVFVEGLNYKSEHKSELLDLVARTFSPVVKKLNDESQGWFSDVYLLQDGKVLKITNEESGADSAFKLKGKNLPGVARIFDVGKLPKKFEVNEPIYYVLLEKLQPLSESEQFQLSDAAERMYLLFNPDRAPFGVLEWDELKEAAYEQADIKKVPRERVHVMLSVFEKFDVPKIADTLAKNNVYALHDWNGGNIMKRGSEYVLVDLGSGKTSPVQHKSVGEAKDRPSAASSSDIKRAFDHWTKTDPAANDYSQETHEAAADDLRNVLDGQALVAFDALIDSQNEMNSLDAETQQDEIDELIHEINDRYDAFIKELRALNVDHILVRRHATYEAKDRPRRSSVEEITKVFSDWASYADNEKRTEALRSVLSGDALDAFEAMLDHEANPQWTEEYNELGMDLYDAFLRELQKLGVKGLSIPPARVTEASGGRTATIGLTIGRFQPFHKDHARLIRQMAERYDKVIVAVAGNKLSADNPFSYDLRRQLMELSLPDVEPKLEVYQVDNGHLPSILEHVASSGGSSYEPGMALEVVIGDDRAEDFKAQVQRAVQNAEAGPDMSAVRVLKSPFDREGGVSGKQIRQALSDASSVEEAVMNVKDLLDPHVSSEPEKLEEIVSQMKSAVDSVKVGKKVERLVREFLTDIAPSKNEGVKVLVQIVNDNKALLKKRGINVAGAEYLGRGSNGAAWRLKDGRIFKVTTDDAEAKIAQHIKGRKLKRVYHVEDVFAFPGTYGDRGHMQYKDNDAVYPARGDKPKKSGGHYVYGLVQEGGLEKPSPQEIDDWTRMEEAIVVANGQDPSTRSITTDNFKKQVEALIASPKFSQAEKRDILQLVKDFGVHQMISELRSLGIEFSDFHAGNFMKRGDTFVVIDLGTGGSQESARPSMIEAKDRPDVFSREELHQALIDWIATGPMSDEEDPDHHDALEQGIVQALSEPAKSAFLEYLKYQTHRAGEPKPEKDSAALWNEFVILAYRADIPMDVISREARKKMFSESITEDETTKTTAKGKAGLHLIGGESGSDEIVEMNRGRLSKLGLNVSSKLGHGSMGTAYDAGGGRVLKVTVDKSEASSNSVLMGKDMKHINKCYRVFRFVETNDAAKRAEVDVFGIVCDKLQPLNSDEQRDIDEISALLTHKDVLQLFATAQWDEIEREFFERLRQQTAEELGSEVPSARIDRVFQRRRQHYDQLFRKYQLPETIEELRKHGVQFADYHSGNVMKRGSDYVVSDLSLSKTPGGTPIDQIEILESLGGMDFAAKPAGTSSWSSGMMASVGRDDTEDRDRLLGWAGRKKPKTESKSGRFRRSRGTRTES